MSKRVLVAIILLGTAALCLAEPAIVAKQTRAWSAQHEREILAELAELLGIPNIARDQPDIERNVREIRAMLAKRGVATQLLTIDGALPIVVADALHAHVRDRFADREPRRQSTRRGRDPAPAKSLEWHRDLCVPLHAFGG